MHRFFLDEIRKGILTLDKNESRHIRVLRLSKGEQLLLYDGNGRCGKGLIEEVGKYVRVRITQVSVFNNDVRYRIFAGVPILKLEHTDFIIKTLAELGISGIYPFISERTVKIKIGNIQSRVKRWERIVQEAIKFSGNPNLLQLFPLSKLDDIIENRHYRKKIMFYENAKDIITKYDVMEDDILFVTGPEGGFSENEVKKAIVNGFRVVNVGKDVLRASIAPIYITGILKYIKEGK